MDKNTLIQIIVSAIVGGISGFGIVAFKLGEYIATVKKLDEDNKQTKEEIKVIRDKVISCETSLKEREPLTRKESPVSLTDRGKKILTDSGGEKFVDNNFDELKNEVDKHTPKTSYDVQELSKQVIEGLRTDDRMNPLKEYLFKEGLGLDDLTTVLGIYLRDKILKDKGWRMED